MDVTASEQQGIGQVTRRDFLKMIGSAIAYWAVPPKVRNKLIQSATTQNLQKKDAKEAEILKEIDPLAILGDLSLLPDMPVTDFNLHSSYRPYHQAYPNGTTFLDYPNPSLSYDLNNLAYPDQSGELINYPDPRSENVYKIAPNLPANTLVTGISETYDNPRWVWDGNTNTGNIEMTGDLIVQDANGSEIMRKPAENFFMDPNTSVLGATYKDVGASVSLYPIVLPEGGSIALTRSPKWFGVESITCSLPIKEPTKEGIDKIAQIRKNPELMPFINNYALVTENSQVSKTQPLHIEMVDEGTIAGLQLKIPVDGIDNLSLRVKYGTDNTYAIDQPLKTFFATEKQLLHHDYPYGVINQDNGKNLLCYLNLPISYDVGTIIEIVANDDSPINVEMNRYHSQQTSDYRLRTWEGERKTVFPGEEDYEVTIPCSTAGKLVSTVLEVSDYDQKSSPNRDWKYAFMESNMRILVDNILRAVYTGQEDFAHGGYFWNEKENTDKAHNPISGGPLGIDLDKGSWCNVFRFFGLSSIPFQKELKIIVGHGYDGGSNGNNLKVTYRARGLYYDKKTSLVS